MKQANQYTVPMLGSILLHVLMLTLLVVSFVSHQPMQLQPPKQEETQPIAAQVVDEKLIAAEVQRQEQAEKKRLAEIKRQKNTIERQQRAAKQAKAEAQRLKKQAQQVKKSAEQAKLKAQKEKEQAKLAQKDAEAAKQAAQKQQQQAQQAAEKALKEKKALEDKQRKIAAAKKKAEELKQKKLAEAKARRVTETLIQRHMAYFRTQVVENWEVPFGIPPGLACKLEILLHDDGKIVQVKVHQSSGNSAYDDLAVRAVQKAAPFEMPSERNARAKFKHFTFTFDLEAA